MLLGDRELYQEFSSISFSQILLTSQRKEGRNCLKAKQKNRKRKRQEVKRHKVWSEESRKDISEVLNWAKSYAFLSEFMALKMTRLVLIKKLRKKG